MVNWNSIIQAASRLRRRDRVNVTLKVAKVTESNGIRRFHFTIDPSDLPQGWDVDKIVIKAAGNHELSVSEANADE